MINPEIDSCRNHTYRTLKESAISTAIVWFRRDLRLADNPALHAAMSNADRIVALYVYAPDEEAPWQPGAASRWWLHHSLMALAQQLRNLGCNLTIRSGASLAEIEDVIRSSGADSVYWNKLYEPALRDRDQRIKVALARNGITVAQFNGTLLFEPDQILTNDSKPYTVFTPFWRKLHGQLQVRPPLPPPSAIPAASQLRSLTVDDLQLLPKIDWYKGFHHVWTPGEDGAEQRVIEFVEGCISQYPTGRDRPDRQHTSRLSPHLHFGEISAHQVAWGASQAAIAHPAMDAGVAAFLREIGWREFANHLLFHFPETPANPLRPAFKIFPWRDGAGDDFAAWCRGNTGIPMVDAGMRELWHTGWMHNRVRMIVASFLTKNQLINWTAGAAWFWDTLVDADLANNTLGWQWTAGCGADAAPFFRIFNPVSQGERFDPDESYVRKWCPELNKLARGDVHAPWRLPATTLSSAGITLGENYPLPVVDLAQSRQAALDAWQTIRK